jgi:hypothetical protein
MKTHKSVSARTEIENPIFVTANKSPVGRYRSGISAILVTSTASSGEIATLIADRDTPALPALMFEDGAPRLKNGFFNEGKLWDFKGNLPPAGAEGRVAWAGIAADVRAFHNNREGVIIFGIGDKIFEFIGATGQLDTKKFNDQIRSYVGDGLWVTFSREFITSSQRFLGVAIIPPKYHMPAYCLKDAPKGSGGRRLLRKGDYCVREQDQTKIYRGTAGSNPLATSNSQSSLYAVDEPWYRILRPDWDRLIGRHELRDKVQQVLYSDRTYVTSLTGIGGVGKTALASWATREAYRDKKFELIVSVTVKDRALTATGIVPFVSSLSSLDNLLNEICVVTAFDEFVDQPLEEKLANVRRHILSQASSLLLVDNLETVDDARLIEFLENLPLPTKAIVTSRRSRVKIAMQPVPIGPLSQNKSIEFL